MLINNFFKKLYEYFLVTMGGIFNALALHVFINPNKLIPGGFSGIASLLHYVIPNSDMSLIYIIINIPLLIGAVVFIKGDFTVKTIWATIVCTIMLAVLPKSLIFVDAPLIGVIFGGFLIGVAMYIASIGHGSNGGTEVIAKLVLLKHPEKDISHIIMLCNVGILSVGAVVLVFFRGESVWIALYSIIFALTGSSVMGMLTRGFNHPQKFIVVTSQYKLISKEIVQKLRRGLNTIDTFDIDGKLTDKKAVMVICQYRQSGAIKKIIRRYDPQAFVFIKDVHYVFSRPDFHRSYNYDK